jgi:FKBP-type peptidyl-prolyl cis-trans isomerase FklB
MNIKRYFSVLIFTMMSFSAFAAAEVKTDEQKLSYSMGTYFAMGITQQEIKLDVPAFIQAVEDVLNKNEPKISIKEMQEILGKYKETVAAEEAKAIAKNKKAGEAFLAENKKKEDVVVTASGLQYKILTKGSGEKPAAGSNVTVHYKGTLIDGTVFDSSYSRGEAAELSLGQVIKGWQEVVPMMTTGSKWQVYVPADLAYGDRAASEVIGPASTLIFDIELISIN